MADSSQRLLRNATVIDGTGSAPLQHHSILLKDGVIEWIGPHDAEPPVSPEIQVHDLSGSTVLPGIIDCHVHFVYSGQINPASTLHEPPGLGRYRVVKNMALTLNAGVTAVRDLAGTDYAAAVAVEQGLIAGPTTVVAFEALGPTAGHSDFRTLSVPFGHHQTQGMLPNIADNPDEARKLTREIIRVGAGAIKVMATGGVWSPRDSPEHVGMSIDDMRAVVEEADNRGIYVAAHAQGAAGIKNALAAGVKSIEHGYLIDDEGIQMMLDNDAWLVPTLLTGTTPPDPAKATPYAVEKKNRVRAQLEANVSRAFDAGVKVALGTDSGVVAHGQNLRELGLMVKLGLTPDQAIVAGTSEAAKLLGLADSRGRVAVGMVADLIVTPLDPRTNIDGLGDPANITMVFQAGTPVKTLP